MAEAGVPVLAVTTKEKLRALLGAGGVPTWSAERAARAEARRRRRSPSSWAGRTPASTTGTAPTTRSSWRWRSRSALGVALLYVSLTDAVQHAAAPGGALSDRYLVRLDELVGAYLDAGCASAWSPTTA